MVHRGRGSAIVAAITILLLFVVSENEVIEAATTYSVGGGGGWTFNVSGWPKGKRFRAGDTLVFKYGAAAHNVVAVNKAGYQTCKPPSGAKVYQSGTDKIKLVKGPNYFICSIPGHCQSGMKIAISAL